jgi:hypothetical protein
MSTLGKLATFLVVGPIAVLVLGIGGCEATKAYYDRRVRSMCDVDGGVRIIEKVTISRDLFRAMNGENGSVPTVPHESLRNMSIPFYLQQELIRIHDGILKVSRTEYRVVRRSDLRVVGVAVVYSRSGGDFPFTASEPSYFRCPQTFDLERQQFTVKD